MVRPFDFKWDTIKKIWNKARRVPGRDPSRWRFDALGWPVSHPQRLQHGGMFAYQVDHKLAPKTEDQEQNEWYRSVNNGQLLSVRVNWGKGRNELCPSMREYQYHVYPTKCMMDSNEIFNFGDVTNERGKVLFKLYTHKDVGLGQSKVISPPFAFPLCFCKSESLLASSSKDEESYYGGGVGDNHKSEDKSWLEAAGNRAYKREDYCMAMKYYTKAIELDDLNYSCFAKRAAVYLEISREDECIEDCDTALERGRRLGANSTWMSRVLTRKGIAVMNLAKSSKDFDVAIELFKKALTERNYVIARKKLKEAVSKKDELERQEKDHETPLGSQKLKEAVSKKDELEHQEKYHETALRSEQNDPMESTSASQAWLPQAPRRKAAKNRVPVSDVLSKFAGGVTELARTEAVRLVWVHIKANKLQNPAKKSEIFCDATLKSIFWGREKVTNEEIFQLLKPHFMKK